MKKLYEKNELWFAMGWIIVYCVSQTVANELNKAIGIEGLFTAILNIVLTVILFSFLWKNGLMKRYGLCKSPVPARKFLWFIPLVVIVSFNLWNGTAVNQPPLETACYLCCMLCVGFVEEIIFRGFLFRAMAKDNLRNAVVVSSVTFGLGHILNLVIGVNDGLVESLCQVVSAIAIGFLFVVIFYRGRSLIPCIVAHSAFNMVSAFANEAGFTEQKHILLCAALFAIVALYTLVLTKTLPQRSGLTDE